MGKGGEGMEVSLQYVQLYLDRVYDLFALEAPEESPPLPLREGVSGGVYVQGARTLARVGLATVCLRDHAAKYGLLGSTATAKQAAAQARLWDIPALAA